MKAADNELILNVKEDNCSESYSELVLRHEKLYYKICQKYSNVVKSSDGSLDDLLSDKDFVFLKSLKSYNPEKKSKFSTWLANHARYHCLNFIKDNCKYIKFESEKDLENFLEARANSQLEDYDDQNKKELKFQIFNILSKLKDGRIHRVYEERYNDDGSKQTWAKIAKKLNISTQTVINLHGRGSKILKYKMKSQKLLDFV
jgi:RNA polymerase sigma factor (sigma-70 family)